MRCSLALVLTLASSSGIAGTVTVPGTDVRFDAPEDFPELTLPEIDVRFPSKRAPQFAIGNALRATTIAHDLKPVAIA